MTRNLRLNFISKISIAILAALPVITAAQVTPRSQNVYSRSDVNTVIKALETSSTSFRKNFAREIDASNINGTSLENEYNGFVKNYENALSTLRRNFDRSENWWESKNDAQRLIATATTVNELIVKLPFSAKLTDQWSRMRNDVNVVADTYDLPGINGVRSGGTGTVTSTGVPNEARSIPPTWMVGTFYSTSGPRQQLNVFNDGNVIVDDFGRTTYGRFYQGEIIINGLNYAISRSGDGIQLRGIGNGQITGYTRNPNVAAGTSTPDWTQGEYTSTGGTKTTLTISPSGQVASTAKGQTMYGTIDQNVVTMGGEVFDVTTTKKGIRLTSRSTGKKVDYKRN